MTRRSLRLPSSVILSTVVAIVLSIGIVQSVSAQSAAHTAGSALPVPTTYGGTRYSAVSCTSRSFCMAVGTYTNRAYFSFGVAAKWNGSQWHLVDLPLAENVHGSWALSAVSCLSPTWCMALGGSRGMVPPFSELWNGRSWARKNIQINAGNLGVYIDSLSCPSTSFCVAAGNASGGVRDAVQTFPEAAEWNGSGWHALSLPKSISGYGFSGMSCAGADDCTFIADSNFLASDWAKGARLVQLTGNSWSLLSPQPPPHGDVIEYQGISCADSSSCAVAGTATPTVQNGVKDKEITFMATLSGTSWHTTDLQLVRIGESGATNMSCPSSAYCLATIPGETFIPRPAEVLKLNTGSGKVTLLENVPQVDALSAPCATSTACAVLVASCSSCNDRLVFFSVPAAWNWAYTIAVLLICAVLLGAGLEIWRRRRTS